MSDARHAKTASTEGGLAEEAPRRPHRQHNNTTTDSYRPSSTHASVRLEVLSTSERERGEASSEEANCRCSEGPLWG